MSRARTLSKLFNTDGNLNLSPVASINSEQVSGRRNLIINGAQIVSQRNGTTDTTISSTGNVYTLDRWGAFVSQTGKISVQQSTDVPSGYGFKNSAKVTSLTAYSISDADYFGYNTALEGQDVAHLGFGASGAKSITISFWVKCSLTGTFGIAVREQPSSPGRSFPTNYTISSANTWEYKTLTISGDTSGTWTTDNTAGFNLWFDLGTGSDYQGTANQWNSANDATTSGTVSVVGTNSSTWFVTGVQVEVGSTATDFEHRTFGEEQALCYRYFVDDTFYGQGYVASGSDISIMVTHPVTMRANPTRTLGTENYNSNTSNIQFRLLPPSDSKNYSRAYATPSASGNIEFGYDFTLDAEL